MEQLREAMERAGFKVSGPTKRGVCKVCEKRPAMCGTGMCYTYCEMSREITDRCDRAWGGERNGT